jgi:DNA-binding GntR family transcriptional regulator
MSESVLLELASWGKVQRGESPPERWGDHDEATAANLAYIRLKNLIVSLELRPGSTLRESELQERLGVGRTPLRDALHHLAHDGMLRIYPRRAVVVAQLGMSQIREIFEVRLALEPAAAALAAERRTPSELAALVQLSTELRASRERPDASKFLEADRVFHGSLAQYAQNTLLVAYIERLQVLNVWLWNMYFETCGVRHTDLFAHEPIIEAVGAAHPKLAENAMREHILRSKEQLLTGF